MTRAVRPATHDERAPTRSRTRRRRPPTRSTAPRCPAGIAAWSKPGLSLTPVAGTAAATCCTNSHEGEMSSRRKVRRVRPVMSATPRVRRAGSSQAPTRLRPGSTPKSHVLGAAEPGARVRPRAQVGVGHRGGHRVGVDAADGHPERGQGHRVGADAAAEVVDGGEAGPAEAVGVGDGDLEPGRLLEAVRREEHVGRELAELGGGPRAQPLLGQGRRRERGRVTGVAQAGLEGEDGGVAVGRERPEQLLPLGACEGPHRADVHRPTFSSREGRPRGAPTLPRLSCRRSWTASPSRAASSR